MKRLEVIYGEDVSASLENIVQFILINGGGIDAAERFIARIRARCERIGDVPFGGRPRDDLFPGLRTVPFEDSAVIAYVVRDEQVAILDVFYGGRDYEALYRDEAAPGG
ncbi:type II toxin-antitoxin system RelE/ParE family toxin [Ancylobacter radicis]|uniref:Type II toxin-antitoxin system RelE/ParE family toxin n=1 Tax=Ancylobacter radicis TaxID=2836179 RepID=A0ABS5R976_9HYPH|nr:type II toxin-antitoxin system RelE/ParE family toxin [Ancylobacter radicis]MBS9478224.1 type II toxin-antitoxin system RelE/ParE family toxin [Ancylobacter radicis]